MVLPSKPLFHPRQYETCAVVGNSGDLLKNEFGREIDDHDAVIRDNEAPVNEKYAKYVGMKRNFCLLASGVARNMITVANGSTDEVLIIKSVIHRNFNTMIQEFPNLASLLQGLVLQRGYTNGHSISRVHAKGIIHRRYEPIINLLNALGSLESIH